MRKCAVNKTKSIILKHNSCLFFHIVTATKDSWPPQPTNYYYNNQSKNTDNILFQWGFYFLCHEVVTCSLMLRITSRSMLHENCAKERKLSQCLLYFSFFHTVISTAVFRHYASEKSSQ